MKSIELRCNSIDSITPSGMYNVDISVTLENGEEDSILDQIDNDVIVEYLEGKGYKVEEQP